MKIFRATERKLIPETSLFLTNSEFFRDAMYFTDEVKLREEDGRKFVNEFLVLHNIGKGSYSKVKKVMRLEHGSETMAKMKEYF